MPKVVFLPQQQTIETSENTKILAVANRAKVPIRFGCGAARCGTCGVKISGDGVLSAPKTEELDLLKKMGLEVADGVRLACQARIMSGTATVDLAFQDSYSPDDTLES